MHSFCSLLVSIEYIHAASSIPIVIYCIAKVLHYASNSSLWSSWNSILLAYCSAKKYIFTPLNHNSNYTVVLVFLQEYLYFWRVQRIVVLGNHRYLRTSTIIQHPINTSPVTNQHTLNSDNSHIPMFILIVATWQTCIQACKHDQSVFFLNSWLSCFPLGKYISIKKQ